MKTKGILYVALISAGMMLAAESRKSRQASPEGFQVISRAKVLTGRCWTMPVLAGGRIDCRNHEGDLVCLDVSGK